MAVFRNWHLLKLAILSYCVLPNAWSLNSTVLTDFNTEKIIGAIKSWNIRIFADFESENEISEILHSSFKQQLSVELVKFENTANTTAAIQNHEYHWKYRKFRMVNLVLRRDETPRPLVLENLGFFTRKDVDIYLFLTQGGVGSEDMKWISGLDFKYKLILDMEQEEIFRVGVKRPTLTRVGHGDLGSSIVPLFDRAYKKELNGYRFRFSCASRVIAYIELARKGTGWYAKRGYFKTIFEYVMQDLNSSYVIFPGSGDGVAGVLLPNQTWIGVVGDVIRNEADFGTAAINHKGFEVAGFTFPIAVEYLTFTHAKPQAIYTAKALIQPFGYKMWLLILLTFMVQTLVLAAYLLVYKRGSHKSILAAPGSALLINSAIMFEQAPPGADRGSEKVKLICVIWSVFALLIGTAYRSKLLGVLAFPLFEEYPRTFAQLSQSNLKYGLLYYGGGAIMIFSSSKHPVYSKMYKNMETERNVVQCLNRTLHERFCCLTYKFQADLAIAKSFSDKFGRSPVVLAEPSAITVSVGIVTGKNSLLLDLLDLYVKFASAHDLLRIWKNEDFERVRKEGEPISIELTTDNVEGAAVLTLRNLQGAFWLWVFGISACTGSFLVEYFFYSAKIRIEKARRRWRLTWIRGKYFRKWKAKVLKKQRNRISWNPKPII